MFKRLLSSFRAFFTEMCRPEGFWFEGSYLVEGQDYHGGQDKQLIQKHGLRSLNFDPSTPPAYR